MDGSVCGVLGCSLKAPGCRDVDTRGVSGLPWGLADPLWCLDLEGCLGELFVALLPLWGTGLRFRVTSFSFFAKVGTAALQMCTSSFRFPLLRVGCDAK